MSGPNNYQRTERQMKMMHRSVKAEVNDLRMDMTPASAIINGGNGGINVKLTVKQLTALGTAIGSSVGSALTKATG